jgi:TATA-box binding protein (TBP) (component of TFIID and TFIIIB)
MKNEVSWKYEIGQRIVEYNNKNIIKDITIIDRKIEVEKLKDKRKQKGFTTNNIKYYKYKCNLCEFRCDEHYKNGEYKEEYWIRESFIKHSNCLFCTGQIVISGVNDISTTHPHLIKYFKNIEDTYKYSYGSNKKLISKCPDCGFEKEYKINVITIHGFSCTICSDGIKYPNKFSYELLNQLNKTYKFAYLEHEYSPDWIGKMSYDNYFIYNGKEYIIEMDGGFHNKDNNMSGQTKEESKLIDDYKDKLAKEHKIEVVRIDCDYGNELNKRFELIKDNILSSNKLNQIFDLNKIDWLKCNEFACDNLIKEVCKIWNTDKYTTVTLSKEVKLVYLL